MDFQKYTTTKSGHIKATVNGVETVFKPSPKGASEVALDFERQGLVAPDWVAPPATWETVRGKRNQLLKDTDWQGMSDVTMSDAQKAYRKKLRDLPATNADPTKIVFPDAP